MDGLNWIVFDRHRKGRKEKHTLGIMASNNLLGKPVCMGWIDGYMNWMDGQRKERKGYVQ